MQADIWASKVFLCVTRRVDFKNSSHLYTIKWIIDRFFFFLKQICTAVSRQFSLWSSGSFSICFFLFFQFSNFLNDTHIFRTHFEDFCQWIADRNDAFNLILIHLNYWVFLLDINVWKQPVWSKLTTTDLLYSPDWQRGEGEEDG